jgi:murein DD-endopeptidase MepM/ murein hydrolase activator NlpD
MVLSAMILLCVVGTKLAMPDVLDRYRDTILDLIGENTDFVAAFSAVGEAISQSSAGDAWQYACREVFGSGEVEEAPAESAEPADQSDAPPAEGTGDDTADEPQTEAPEETAPTEEAAVVYTAENLPDNVCMEQRVLGFSCVDPVAGTLTSGFGYRDHPIEGGEKFHYGLDIAADEGTVITAFAAGIVTAVGQSSELGNYVMVSHADHYATLYAHCSRITASSGQSVQPGDPIAEVGQSGEATGPHLHFELQQNTTFLNPIYYVSYQ